MRIIALRLDAPLMSFGGVVVDSLNRTDPLPYRAMLTGLLANALGLARKQEAELSALQERLRYAARRDRRGSPLLDYQTVDLSAIDAGVGWTFRGELETRKGGDASSGTHIRYRHYLADALITVVLTLEPEDPRPSMDEVVTALRSPARPLFIGRKCCIPSGPLYLGTFDAPSLREALERIPRAPGLRPEDPPRSEPGRLHAIWPLSEVSPKADGQVWPRVEDRDFANSIHVGRRMYAEGWVDPRTETSAEDER